LDPAFLRLKHPGIINMGWLDDYVRFHSSLTDSPKVFAEVLGLTLLGQAAGRPSVHPLRPSPVRHNIFAILLGQPGRARKSTSLSIARSVCPFHFYPEQFSPEGILDEFVSIPHGLLPIDEMSGLLKRAFDRRSYMAATLELLNRTYDCPESLERKTKSGGLVQAKDLYVSLVSATTTDQFKTSIEPEALEGGFLTRNLIVQAGRTKIEPRGYIDERTQAEHVELSNTLKRIHERSLALAAANKPLTFKFEGDALEAYHGVCEKIDRRYRKTVNGGFLSRYSDYVVKIADLKQLSEDAGRLPFQGDSQDSQSSTVHVTSESLIFASSWIEDRLHDVERICEFCESAKPILRLKAVLEKHGRLTRGGILRYGHMMANELKLAIDTTLESGEVVEYGGEAGGIFQLAPSRRRKRR
jgi:uncharacterized protein DUF3987